jgi:hypothetical protein
MSLFGAISTLDECRETVGGFRQVNRFGGSNDSIVDVPLKANERHAPPRGV